MGSTETERVRLFEQSLFPHRSVKARLVTDTSVFFGDLHDDIRCNTRENLNWRKKQFVVLQNKY